MYERLVDQVDNKVQGYVAYGLYKTAKREWMQEFVATQQRKPRPAEVEAYVTAFTPQMVEAFKSQAASALVAFSDSVVADARPEIVESALRGGFWRSVWQSISANAIYTVGLFVVALIIASAGVDLLGVFDKVRQLRQ